MRRWFLPLALSLLVAGALPAQESQYGISVPVTIAGNALYTNAKQTDDGLQSSGDVGFRAVASPALRLGAHWFLYSSLEFYSSSYYTGSTYSYDEHAVRVNLLQAFAGYSAQVGQTSLLFKAGQLSSAFGLGPLGYDDSRMPLLAPARTYTTRLNLRPDQIPCGSADVLAQRVGGDIDFHCGGAESDAYGLTPVTLHSLPGIEAEVSAHRIDARLQFTNSSPANPQNLNSGNQSPQLTLGAGYTFRDGFHIGFSQFRGPYLDASLAPVLPIGTSVRRFNATGTGADLQWSRAAWSTEGEWQRFYFDLPGFTVSPAVYAGYGQLKRIVTPRTFVAARLTLERFGRVVDSRHATAPRFQMPQNTYEVSAGYRVNRSQLIKAGFLAGSSGLSAEGASPQVSNTIQIQLVTEIPAISRSFR